MRSSLYSKCKVIWLEYIAYIHFLTCTKILYICIPFVVFYLVSSRLFWPFFGHTLMWCGFCFKLLKLKFCPICTRLDHFIIWSGRYRCLELHSYCSHWAAMNSQSFRKGFMSLSWSITHHRSCTTFFGIHGLACSVNCEILCERVDVYVQSIHFVSCGFQSNV